MFPDCSSVHTYLLDGICPRCGVRVGANEDPRSPFNSWNVSKMLQEMDDPVTAASLLSLPLLRNSRFEPLAALTIYRKALACGNPEMRRHATYELHQLGCSHLDKHYEAQIRRLLELDQADAAARIVLLSYWRINQYDDSRGPMEYRTHLLWMIRFQPDSPLLERSVLVPERNYERTLVEEVRTAWLQQLRAHSSHLPILRNAAECFAAADIELAKETLARARELEPDNPEWTVRLGRLALGNVKRCSAERGAEHAAEAFQLLVTALDLTVLHEDRVDLLSDVASAAFCAGYVEQC